MVSQCCKLVSGNRRWSRGGVSCFPARAAATWCCRLFSGKGSGLTALGYDAWDVLPVAPASDSRRVPPPESSGGSRGVREACFPSEKEFKARMNALLDALAEQERRRNHSLSLEDVWEDEWGREQRGEEVRKPAKVARVDDPNEGGGEASRFGDEVARLWSDEWSIEEMSG